MDEILRFTDKINFRAIRHRDLRSWSATDPDTYYCSSTRDNDAGSSSSLLFSGARPDLEEIIQQAYPIPLEDLPI